MDFFHPGFEGADAAKRYLAGHGGIKCGTQAVNIATRIGQLGVFELFWGHEVGSAQAAPGAGEVQVGLSLFHQTQVCQFRLTFGGDEDIFGLHIAVHQPQLVGPVQPLSHLAYQPNSLQFWQAPFFFHIFRQIFTLNQFHHQVGNAFDFAIIESLDHIGMVESAGGAKFLFKAAQQHRVDPCAFRHHFDGDGRRGCIVGGAVNRTHPTRAYAFQEGVRAHLPGKRWRFWGRSFA